MNRFIVPAAILVAGVLAGCNSTSLSPLSALRSTTILVRNQTRFSAPPDTVATKDTIITIDFVLAWNWVDGTRLKTTVAPGGSACYERLLTNSADSATVSGVFERHIVDSTNKTLKVDTIASAASAKYFADYLTGAPNVRATFSDSLTLVVDTLTARCP